MSMETTPPSSTPLNGLWQPHIGLSHLFYGSGCVEKSLVSLLPSPHSKVFIITGSSLATKTPLVGRLESLLGSHHIGTVSNIKQHGPISDVEAAIERVLQQPGVNVLVSLGGGSPIDTAKVISLRAKERHGAFLKHITIPTTLSAAECTNGGGYTKLDGVKVGFRVPGMGVSAIFYDPDYARHTPRDLWLSSGMRALDHAVESMYHPCASEVPWKALSLWAAGELFHCLPLAAKHHPDDDEVTVRLLLAAFASSGLKGENLKGGMGLSHSLGHALGSPYGIPHGITSCMTLAKVVKLKASQSLENAIQIQRLLPAIGGQFSGDVHQDAVEVADRITALVNELGLAIGNLSARGLNEAEVSLIMKRAVGDEMDRTLYQQIESLVRSLF